jgi:hypothetical protein
LFAELEPANNNYNGFDTVHCTSLSRPSLGIADLNQGWNAGGEYSLCRSNPTVDGYTFGGYNSIGLIKPTWSSTTITFNGFGNALPNYYPYGYHIHNRDTLLIVVFAPGGITYALISYTGPSF